MATPRRSRTARGPGLAIRALLAGMVVTTAVACGGGTDDPAPDSTPLVTPVGKLLDDTDEQGRRYREIDEDEAPAIGMAVRPDASDDGWRVRLTVHRFRFAPPGTAPVAVPGRGYVLLFLDGRPLDRLRGPDFHLPGSRLSRGTHALTARLYADDGTVWAVKGKPVEGTADLTVEPRETP
ncbi:hypothetical protein ACIQNU_36310 [Streptomyces sp. NPDC091292]|uniref:hypothetical protein n=1 Tax=Streptomyces sp. NPDC091292 TaxID=3365991 RepID=UPI00381CDC00